MTPHSPAPSRKVVIPMADEQTTTGEVVAIRKAEPDELPDALQAITGRAAITRYMSFNPKTAEGRILLDKCSVAADDRVKKQVNLPLRIQDIFLHRITLINPDTAEVLETTRTCLITPDGKVLACVSAGVVEAVIRLIDGHGLPPWTGGIPVKVLLQDRPNGRQWLTLVNDESAPTNSKRVHRP